MEHLELKPGDIIKFKEGGRKYTIVEVICDLVFVLFEPSGYKYILEQQTIDKHCVKLMRQTDG